MGGNANQSSFQLYAPEIKLTNDFYSWHKILFCKIGIIHLLPAISCAECQQNANATGYGCAAANVGVAASGSALNVVGRRWGLGEGEVNRY